MKEVRNAVSTVTYSDGTCSQLVLLPGSEKEMQKLRIVLSTGKQFEFDVMRDVTLLKKKDVTEEEAEELVALERIFCSM